MRNVLWKITYFDVDYFFLLVFSFLVAKKFKSSKMNISILPLIMIIESVIKQRAMQLSKIKLSVL